MEDLLNNIVPILVCDQYWQKVSEFVHHHAFGLDGAVKEDPLNHTTPKLITGETPETLAQ